jgi:hypothetical protein
MKIQVTLISENGYKPMSTIVDVPKAEKYSEAMLIAKDKGVIKICTQRSMSMFDLRKYGYKKVKMRIAEEV